MRIYRCWFCSSPIYPGHGTLFVRNDCKEFRFCRGKCHKAFKKHKNPRKVRWTKVSRRIRGKELTDDLAQTFERKRNSLFKYERATVQKIVSAVPKIDQIKHKRESAFIRKRLIKGVQLRTEEDIKLVNTQMHLIEAPEAKRKRELMDVDSESDLSVEDTMDLSLNELEKQTNKGKVADKSKARAKKQKIALETK
ncbi:putative ribosome biogenesis protein [Schistosoma japonicum]|uniref:Probable ribosome biogenesis protein RLP24 n=1 Tax=Schistosoma japonicum TaxID=6182 RepID=A0A4Z2DM90_SCHJA|nr:putative ribosome biogenesis protein RLP24 [Schistosoma japonicum]TNN17508.1 putative ribosome biogenesis protein [Schistosoma japonicum]